MACGDLTQGGSFSNTAPYSAPQMPQSVPISNGLQAAGNSLMSTPQMSPFQLPANPTPAPAQAPISTASPSTGTDATAQAIQQANATVAAMKILKDSKMFQTPYQQAMQQHPILMGLSNGLQAFGQGLTHQPIYTQNQQAQADLQNTQLQGINGLVTLPAQLKMMMAMQQMYQNPGSTSAAGNPGTSVAPVINTPGASASPAMPSAPANPFAAQMAAARAAGYSDQEIQAYLAGKK